MGQQVTATRAEGPHLRAALWVSGCAIRCPGCCNPELFARESGRKTSLCALRAWISKVQQRHDIEGVSVLGGEPLEQWEALAPWLAWLRTRGLGVIVFTGLRWEKVARDLRYGGLDACVDTLVDGPFVQNRPEPLEGRAVVGSRNQNLVHFSPRYACPELWRGPRRAQIDVLENGDLQVHGAPQLVSQLRVKLSSRP